jgi:hypothetical protein
VTAKIRGIDRRRQFYCVEEWHEELWAPLWPGQRRRQRGGTYEPVQRVESYNDLQASAGREGQTKRYIAFDGR